MLTSTMQTSPSYAGTCEEPYAVCLVDVRFMDIVGIKMSLNILLTNSSGTCFNHIELGKIIN